MLLITIIILWIMFFWRLLLVKDLNVYLAVFWIIWPDIPSLIPIGLSIKSSDSWPTWGPRLYNFFHTLLVAIPVVTGTSLALGTIQWAMLGWVVHVTGDRSLGFYLRAAVRK
jgi:hypothetical protein